MTYYTGKGHIYGKLILTKYELIFEPLHDDLKGFIDQSCG